MWSRPDLALVALWRTKYSLSWHLDVHGFEVKAFAGCSPTAVHEALSHAALVHFSHLVWNHPAWSESEPACKAILDRCSRYGIGLITFVDPDNADSFTIRQRARRNELSGEAIDEFIETRFSEDNRRQLAGWIEELR